MTTLPLPGFERPELGGPEEFFPTPQPLADMLAAWVRTHLPFSLAVEHTNPRILEPSAGTGNFVRAARKVWPDAYIVAVDVQDTRSHCVEAGADRFVRADFVQLAREGGLEGGAFDLIIGNPPFAPATEHVDAAFACLRPSAVLAYMLRLTFWETPDRAALFTRHPVNGFAPIVQRPSHSGDGHTDSAGVGLFVWQREQFDSQIFFPIDWRGGRP